MTWLPLTAAQRGLFFAHQLAPDNPCYTTAEVVELDDRIEAPRLAWALAAAYDEFEQLRTTYRLAPEGPQQRVVDGSPALQVVDVASAAEAESWMAADLARPMDLLAGEVTRSALLRFPAGAWWYHAGHHVVLDGYGAQQLLHRVAELYGDPTPKPAVSLADVVATEPVTEGATVFWDARLRSMHGVVSPSGRQAPAAPAALRQVAVLDAERQQEIVAGARRLGTSWLELVTAALGCYVARIAGLSQSRIGIPLMNRTAPGRGTLASGLTVCTAMNVLPLAVPADATVADALAAVKREQAALREHPYLRQEDLARRLRAFDEGAQLFGVQVNLVPFELELWFGGVAGRVRNLTAGPVEDMTICMRGTPGRGRHVRLEIDASPTLYDAGEVSLHLARVAHWISVFANAEAEARVADLDLLTSDERRLVVETFNSTTVERESATLGARFLAQATRTPDATALVFRDEIRTYAELLDTARQIATGLSRRGVGAGDVVGVALERSIELYEVLHAIQLLGAVYLPLAPDLPAARMEGMREDAKASYVVTAGDIPRDQARPITAAAGVDDPAYILFTSGSTGRPKGVVVSHRAIDNRLAWMQHHLPLQPGDRVLHKTPISFDVSVWELYWPLQVGATVVIAPPGAHRDPRALADLVAREQITTLHFVPSMLRAFLADRVARERVAEAGVSHVVTSGEALTPDLVEGAVRWFGVAPTNLYGPTEAAVDVTVHDCVPGEEQVPIGRPIWNTSCLVLDERLRPVPIGVTGELWLGGVQLAQGYAGRPDLTAERFVDSPYGRIYRTGDLAAWRQDGELRYVGRADDQVKVRGQRIELGEIEAAVAGVAGVDAVAAGMAGDRLAVWFVPAGDAGKAELALREAADARLPRSFHPHHWIAVDEMPLSSSGKTDRKRLAELAPLPVAGVEATGPASLLEQQLCEVMAGVLGAGRVGSHDDFFMVGGDSLRVLQLVSRVEETTGTTLSLADVFAHPTPAGLAALLSGDRAGNSDVGELVALRCAPGSDKAPLFVLPPAGGLGWCYSGLLRSLPVDQPVYTVQAPGLTEGAPEPVADLDALAARQLAVIRSVTGSGRFHVAGWSLGGMAAHAVAALASREGQEVGAVALLDAYPSSQWQHLGEPTESEALLGILRLGGVDVEDVSGLDRTTTLRLLRESGSAVGSLPERILEGCLASVIDSSRVVRTSAHHLFDGDVTVFVATAPRAEAWLDADGWRPFTGGAVRVVPVGSTHGEMVRPPYVDEIGAVVARLLD